MAERDQDVREQRRKTTDRRKSHYAGVDTFTSFGANNSLVSMYRTITRIDRYVQLVSTSRVFSS